MISWLDDMKHFPGILTKIAQMHGACHLSTASRYYCDVFWSASACCRLGWAKLASPDGHGTHMILFIE